MVVKIEEPRVEQADLSDWQKFLYRTTIQGGGFIFLMITNINSSSDSQIMAGSRLEVNGAYYQVESDESIGGTPVAGVNYVYATPSGNTLSFIYSTATPEYNPLKGGWFNGNNRAIAKMTRIGSNWYNKVILDSQSAMLSFNDNSPIPPLPGTLVYTGNHTSFTQQEIEPGLYYAQLQGGNGAKGGNGGNSSGYLYAFYNNDTNEYYATSTGSVIGNTGENGESALPINILFRVTKRTILTGKVGLNGANGVNGSNGLDPNNGRILSDYSAGANGGGGGGGGGAGEKTVLIVGDLLKFEAIGGNAGNGGDGGEATIRNYGKFIFNHGAKGLGGLGGVASGNCIGQDGEDGQNGLGNNGRAGQKGKGGRLATTTSGFLRVYKLI